jgi:hypothetical protein
MMHGQKNIKFYSNLSSEVVNAIMELRHRKRIREYGILSKCLKLGVTKKVLPITELFNSIQEEKKIPPQWKSTTTIILPHHGSKDDLNDYRSITLFSNMYKLLSKILSRKFTRILNKYEPPDQAGFHFGFSITGHLQALK